MPYERAANLAQANVINFDGGFEVWVYKGRYAADVPKPAEFVVLFAPSGLVKKFRTRPPQKGV